MRAAHSNDLDWTLNELVRWVDTTGFPFPLTVLTGGVFIRGIAVKVDQWADHLDATVDELLEGAARAMRAGQAPVDTAEEIIAADTTVGDIEQRRTEWPQQGFRHQVDERRAGEAETNERLGEAAADGGEAAPLDSLPDDLVERAVAMDLPKTALTLQGASVFGAGPPVTLPYVRVVLRQVDAWWPGMIDWDSLAT
jgi:hypothetical protein